MGNPMGSPTGSLMHPMGTLMGLPIVGDKAHGELHETSRRSIDTLYAKHDFPAGEIQRKIPYGPVGRPIGAKMHPMGRAVTSHEKPRGLPMRLP